MNAKTKRILCGAGAAAVALALVLGGTFAYTLFEHKSNPMRNDPGYQGRLIEDFDPDPTWNPDCKIKKEVSVKNMGGTAQFPGNNWGDIFVRVKLKEHMDVTPIEYMYYPADDTQFNTRFMVDKNGNFVRFAATGALPTAAELAAIKNNSVWNSVVSDSAKRIAFLAKLQAGDFIKLRGYYDTQDYWYLVTKEGGPNGQYGAFVAADKRADESKRFSLTGSSRAAGVDYTKGIVTYDPAEHNSGECLYPTHLWAQADPARCALEAHKYAKWELGGSVVMAANWNGLPVGKWILDPATGWATWGDALRPGESTDLLLKAIQPLLFPDGDMLYVIHADMQATDRTQMLTGDWDGDDWIIKGAFGGGGSVPATTEPVTTGEVPGTAAPQGIPVKGGEFQMQGSDTDTLNYAVQAAINKDDFAGAQLKVPGTLKLSDVLASGFDTRGLSVTAVPASLNAKAAIGKDKDGADALVISYFGTEQDWLPTLGHPDQYPPVQMTLVLHKAGYADTAIKVNLAFNGSIYG